MTATTSNFSLSKNLASNLSLAAKKKKSYHALKPILRASESLLVSFFQTLGVILLFALLLQPLASWIPRPLSQNYTWKETVPLSTSHLEKTTYHYDAVSGSSLYCNGDPVNGLDPDGRCVEGFGTAAYDMGTGAVQLGSNILGTAAYATTSGFGMFGNETSDNFAGSWQGLQNTWSGIKYLGSQALNGNFVNLGVALTGGEGRSAGFRTGYAGMSILAMALAGEVGEAGEVADAGTVTKVAAENPIIVVGEGMQRVNAFSQEMAEQGINTRTYPAINMNRPINPNVYGSLKSLNANRSWLDYWARGKGADVIDIGPQPGRSISSPYYNMEVQNLYLWEQANKINPVIRFDPGY